jgi:hypothetical protein
MGAYCTRTYIRRHEARTGEVMTVKRLFDYHEAALFGDNEEIACISHKGCRLEIVGTAESPHQEVNLLLPGQVVDYTRSFFFGDRLELPSGTKVRFWQLVGFRFQLASPPGSPPPVEEAIVRRAGRDKAVVT